MRWSLSILLALGVAWLLTMLSSALVQGPIHAWVDNNSAGVVDVSAGTPEPIALKSVVRSDSYQNAVVSGGVASSEGRDHIKSSTAQNEPRSRADAKQLGKQSALGGTSPQPGPALARFTVPTSRWDSRSKDGEIKVQEPVLVSSGRMSEGGDKAEPLGGGNAARAPSLALVLKHSVQPAYPELARKAGVEGYVVVEFDVGGDGAVNNIAVVRSTPVEMFEQAAIEAVKQFRFDVPGNIPVENIVTRLEFKLDG